MHLHPFTPSCAMHGNGSTHEERRLREQHKLFSVLHCSPAVAANRSRGVCPQLAKDRPFRFRQLDRAVQTIRHLGSSPARQIAGQRDTPADAPHRNNKGGS